MMIPKEILTNLLDAIPGKEAREIGKKHLKKPAPGMLHHLGEAVGSCLYVNDSPIESIVGEVRATCALFLASYGLVKTTPYVEAHGALWWVFEGDVVSMPADATGFEILNITKVEDADVPEEVIAALNP